MAILAFEKVTAARLNRLQPKKYYAAASGTVAPSLSGVDVPGCSVSITTETANAKVTVEWFASFYAGGTAPTTNGSVQALIDGVGTPVFAIGDNRVANLKFTAAQAYETTIATPGTYTVKLIATTPANLSIAIYTSLAVTVTEVV